MRGLAPVATGLLAFLKLAHDTRITVNLVEFGTASCGSTTHRMAASELNFEEEFAALEVDTSDCLVRVQGRCGPSIYLLLWCYHALLSQPVQDAPFDTCWLLRVRDAVSRGVAFELPHVSGAIADELQRAKSDYLGLGLQPRALSFDGAVQKHDAHRVLEIFRRVWCSLNALQSTHPLYVPPIYECDMLSNLILELILAVRLREHADDGKHPTGHFVVGGVEGTGKTTILHAVAVAVAVCSSRYFLMYVDYKQLQDPDPPERVMAELLVRARKSEFDSQFGSLRSCRGRPTDLLLYLDARMQGTIPDEGAIPLAAVLKALSCSDALKCRVGLIADEIQAMVLPNAHASSPQVVLFRKLESFARHHTGALLILSGSSSNLRARLFRKDRDAAYDTYPDFNQSLTSYYHVSALRTLPELKLYLSQRYKAMFNDSRDWVREAEAILHHTGGIGRLVHDAVTAPANSLPRVHAPASEYRQTSTCFFVLVNCIRRHVGSTCSTLEDAISDAAAASAAPVAAPVAAATSVLRMLSPAHVSMPYASAMLELENHHVSNPEHCIQNWLDMGLLYVDNDKQFVQLARPVDAMDYFVGQASADDLLLLQLVSTMVQRPDLENNAGKPLECLMRPRIHKLLNTSAWSGELLLAPSETGGELVVSVKESDGSVWRVNSETIVRLDKRNFRWRNETGLDGVFFDVLLLQIASTISLTINGWQCKGGAAADEMGGGDIATHRGDKPPRVAGGSSRGRRSSTSSAVARTKPSSAGASDSSCDETSHHDDTASKQKACTRALNAELGFLRLIRALLCSTSSSSADRGRVCRIKLGALIVTTTKGDGTARDWLKSNSRQTIPHDSILRRKLLNEEHLALCETAYDVHLFTGLRWFLESLEEPLRRMWPPTASRSRGSHS